MVVSTANGSSGYIATIESGGKIFFMKRYSFKIGVSLMALVLVGFNAMTALANIRPFHLVEHGTLTPNQDGTITAIGRGTATHLGTIRVRRTFTLTPTSTANELNLEGHATLTMADGDKLETGLEGILVVDPSTNTGHADLTYRWEGGTGRFANASGTTLWHVDVNLADNTYEVVAEGIIKF